MAYQLNVVIEGRCADNSVSLHTCVNSYIVDETVYHFTHVSLHTCVNSYIVGDKAGGVNWYDKQLSPIILNSYIIGDKAGGGNWYGEQIYQVAGR